MFLENSRYFGLPTMTVELRDGRSVRLVQPRRLPSPAAAAHDVMGHDRLDIIAQRSYQDATKFWHIADANTRVEARRLTEPPAANSPTPPMIVIDLPEK